VQPEEVRADPWDRLRVLVTWGAAALLPVWILLFATFAQLAQRDEVPETIDLGTGIVVVVGSDEGGAAPLVQAAVAAALVVGVLGLAGGVAVWVAGRRAGRRSPDPLDPSLYADGATWTATRRRDDGSSAAPTSEPPDPPEAPGQSQLDSTG
jgi:hypothetical protein